MSLFDEFVLHIIPSLVFVTSEIQFYSSNQMLYYRRKPTPKSMIKDQYSFYLILCWLNDRDMLQRND